MKKLLALALGVALGLAQAPSPEALKGLGPEEALALAKRWRDAGAGGEPDLRAGVQ